MEKHRKEIIDFLSLLCTTNDPVSWSIRKKASELLESIISDEPDELRAVGKHEAKENICPECDGTGDVYVPYTNIKTACDYCGGRGQI